MEFVKFTKENSIAVLTLNRGKVNAINEDVVEELKDCLEGVEKNPNVRAIILTGQGKFFSFGFDIPGFMNHSKEDFKRYLTKFTDLYTYLFIFPKPVIAALNGHTIAGGCMIASACDHRIMVEGKAKISLNEITFGSSVFAGSVEMLQFCVGQKNAEKILYTGKMFSAEEALAMGMIDQINTEENFTNDVKAIAEEYAKKDINAFCSIKKLLRKPVHDEMIKREKKSIAEFVEIWYSPETREQLRQIKIHS